MTEVRNFLLVVAGLFLALTYLLVPIATPDTARYERAFGALRTLLLNDAALQRDVLKARAGLLRNYDPLMRSVDNLRHAIDTLRSDSHSPDSRARDDTDRLVNRVAAAVADQEAIVETFKSRNALLQNSLSFFAHTVQQFADNRTESPLSTEVGRLVNAMLQFTGNPRSGSASDVTASLDRLARSPIDPAIPGVGALIPHGRLIVATLPEVDDSVSRLLTAPTTDAVKALQVAVMEAHARAVANASIFGTLLYTASLALLAYVSYLFLRLRANARILRTRLDFERLIAAISTQFINLPHDDIGDGIKDGLSQLATRVGADRAHVILHGRDEAVIAESYLWHRPDIGVSAPLDDVMGMALHWGFAEYEREGCVYVLDVQRLPEGAEKSRLQERGIRSWLCIPMWCTGRRAGFLTLEGVSDRKIWTDEDIALLRTAGQIFANAIDRRQTESEREALEARLHQAQRLDSIGTLAGGIAHEFNNILGAIFGYAELALSTVGGGSRAERHVRSIMTAGERAQSVINRILTFSRRAERRPTLIRAEPIVTEAVELLRASLPTTVAIETKFRIGHAMVVADPTELQQVIMNLCTNGAHAMQNHGTLHVVLDGIEADDDLVLSHGTLSAGRYLRLAVKDSGYGIDAATLERILEPFFTTKAVGQGTGLGLSTVHGIVTQHVGALNVESRPGEGSVFQVYLPRAAEASVAQDEPVLSAIPRGHGETVLIVDDDAPLVPLAEDMLATLGYEAVGFDQSAAALEAFRAAPDRFDLVLTDEIMPDMTGTELAGVVHEIRPSLPIILMTGGGRTIPVERLRAAGIREVVRKPLLSVTIADLLARHLSSRRDLPGESPAGNEA